MIRIDRLDHPKPGKLYHVESDGLTLRIVVTRKTTRHRPGNEFSKAFSQRDIFMFVETVDVTLLESLRQVKSFYPNEKIHHFLLGETSYWVTTASLEKLVPFR